MTHILKEERKSHFCDGIKYYYLPGTKEIPVNTAHGLWLQADAGGTHSNFISGNKQWGTIQSSASYALLSSLCLSISHSDTLPPRVSHHRIFF